MTKREAFIDALLDLSDNASNLVKIRAATLIADAVLLIPGEPKGPNLRPEPCCVCGSLEQAWYITKGPDDPGKVYCATCKPKLEPAKDWLDSEEFGMLTTDYADAYLRVSNGIGGPIPADIRRTKMVPAIRANYISPRETRYREALEAIERMCDIKHGSCSAASFASEALKSDDSVNG